LVELDHHHQQQQQLEQRVLLRHPLMLQLQL
jgi:hypothetical protein